MAKTYEISFKLGAQMAGNFAKTMSSAGGALGNLNKQVSDVSKFGQLKNNLVSTQKEYSTLSAEIARMAKNMHASGPPTKAMVKEFELAKVRAGSLKKSIAQQSETLHKHRQALAASGIKTNDLNGSLKRLADQQALTAQAHQRAIDIQKRADAVEQQRIQRLAKMRAEQEKYTASLQKTMAQIEANQSRRADLRGQMIDAAALAVAFSAPIKMAADFEQQMANVGAKGNATKEELALLTKTARELGATTVFSASQAGQGMEYLAMAGFKTNQIVQAMPGMLNLAAAANTDLGRTADIASDILSGFGLQAADMTRVADVLAKTTVSSNTNLEMLGDTMKYVGPVAKAAGMSLEEAAAMAGLLANVGIKSSQAGTTLRSMLLRLSAPTGKAATALKELGVETRDVNGDARNMVEILGDVAKATEDMGSAERLEALKNIFGEEPAAGMAELIAQGGADGITKYLEVIENSAGTAAKIADDMNATVRGRFRELSSATESLAISVGNMLLPAVSAATKIMTKTAQVLDGFTQKFPTLSKVLVIGTAALMALKVALIAGGYAFTFVKGAVLSVTAAIKIARIAWLLNTGAIVANTTTSKAAIVMSKALAAAQWLVNAALRANPIGLVITGIVALIAAGVALYKNWDTVAAFFSGAWKKMKEGAAAAWNSITNFVGSGFSRMKELFLTFHPLGWMMGGFGRLTNFLSQFSLFSSGQKILRSFGNGVKSLISSPVAAFRSLASNINSYLSNFSLYNSGKKILSTLASGIKSAASVPINAVKNVFARVRKYLPFSDAKIGPLSELTASGSAIMKTLGDGMLKAGPESLTGPFSVNAGGIVDGTTSLGDQASRVNSAAGGGGGITVQITQHIAVGNGVGPEVEAQARSGASAGAADMIRQMREALARERRLSYA